jgi:hypothetical protein
MLVTSDNDYANIEIGDLNEERSEMSTLSHSSSADTLLSIKSLSSPKRGQVPGGQGSGVQHDMNGNPEYEDQQDEGQEEEDSASSSLQGEGIIIRVENGKPSIEIGRHSLASSSSSSAAAALFIWQYSVMGMRGT